MTNPPKDVLIGLAKQRPVEPLLRCAEWYRKHGPRVQSQVKAQR
jgi:hypothetical protein